MKRSYCLIEVTFDQDYSRKELNLRTDIITKYNLIPGEEYILQMDYFGAKIKDKKWIPLSEVKKYQLSRFDLEFVIS